MLNNYNVLTYFGLFARWEHEPSTIFLHFCLFVAMFSISFPVYPIYFVCKVLRRHLLRKEKDRKHPFLTSVFTTNESVVCRARMTLHVMPS